MLTAGESGRDVPCQRAAPALFLQLQAGLKRGFQPRSLVYTAHAMVRSGPDFVSIGLALPKLEVPRLACPGCGQPMSYWGWYARYLRAPCPPGPAHPSGPAPVVVPGRRRADG